LGGGAGGSFDDPDVFPQAASAVAPMKTTAARVNAGATEVVLAVSEAVDAPQNGHASSDGAPPTRTCRPHPSQGTSDVVAIWSSVTFV